MEVITIESVAYQQLMGRIESIASHIERLEATRGVQGIPDTLLNTREAAEILHISTRLRHPARQVSLFRPRSRAHHR